MGIREPQMDGASEVIKTPEAPKAYLDRYYEILNELRPQEERGKKTNAEIEEEAKKRVDSERGRRPEGFIDELNGLEMDYGSEKYSKNVEIFEALAKGENPKGNRDRVFSDWTNEDFSELIAENARYRELHQDKKVK